MRKTLRSKVNPKLIGRLIEVRENGYGIIEIGDRQMIVLLEYWEEI